MTTEVEVRQGNYRHEVPKEYCASGDTRLYWLWNQRFGTVQRVYQETKDLESRLAATIILQAILMGDLESIKLLFRRLEGGPQMDEEVLEQNQIRV